MSACLADAKPFPVVLGGQEFSEALQKTLEALQYGQVSAKDAQTTAPGRRDRDPRQAPPPNSQGFAAQASPRVCVQAARMKTYGASAGVMLAPAVALIGIFVLVPMRSPSGCPSRTGRRRRPSPRPASSALDNFREIFGATSVGRDFKGALANTAIYTALSVLLILPLSVAFGLLVYQRLRGRRHGAAHRAVLDLHGADDRGRAGLLEALFADRGAAQSDARAGSASHRSPGSRRPTRRSSRSSSSMSGSRSAISPCWPSPG